MHFIQSIKHAYDFFRWLRNSLIQDGVNLHLRYQSYLFYASVLWAVYGMSQKEAHELLQALILSSLPQIQNHASPQIAYQTVVELCSLLFIAGLGVSKCKQYRILRSDIFTYFEEYSECHISLCEEHSDISDILEKIM